MIEQKEKSTVVSVCLTLVCTCVKCNRASSLNVGEGSALTGMRTAVRIFTCGHCGHVQEYEDSGVFFRKIGDIMKFKIGSHLELQKKEERRMSPEKKADLERIATLRSNAGEEGIS